MLAGAFTAQAAGYPEGSQLVAEVVAIDQVILLNRLGAALPQGMIFVLKSDVVPSDCYASGNDCTSAPHAPFDLKAGYVILRREKRPRPIVLRANVGDTLTIRFWNLLNLDTAALPGAGLLPATRTASMHLMGMEWAQSNTDDGSMAGPNPSSLASPATGGTASTPPTIYRLYAKGAGSFLLYHPRSPGVTEFSTKGVSWCAYFPTRDAEERVTACERLGRASPGQRRRRPRS